MTEQHNGNGLHSTLYVLDVFIEMQVDALKEYRKLSYKVNNPNAKAVLDWLFDEEELRLRRASVRRQRILEKNPQLNEDGSYEARKETGVSKIGSPNRMFKQGPLDILRYAIMNEVRAQQFFRRKAATVDPTQRMMFLAAASDQEYQIRLYDAQREQLMQKQVYQITSNLTRVAV